jgi:hypothetical protein
VYLNASIRSLLSSKVGLFEYEVHVVSNFGHSHLAFLNRKYPQICIHSISDRTHAGLVKYAFDLGTKYEYCFFIEEDWLFSRKLTDQDLSQLSEIQGVRQVVFSKYRLGHEEEDASAWGSFRLINIAGFSNESLILERYFSLNPTMIRRDVLRYICDNFNWTQPNNSGPHLEMNLNSHLGEEFGPSILIPMESKFKVIHLGLMTATRNIRLNLQNRGGYAKNVMRLHVFLLALKNSSNFLRGIYIPNRLTRFLED